MNVDLFRTEASNSGSAEGGSPLIARSFLAARSLWLLLLPVLAGLLFVAFAEVPRKTRVGGQLVPISGEAKVVAPGSGTVTQMLVSEGQRVDAGQALAVIATNRATGDALLMESVGEHIDRRRASVEDGFASEQRLMQVQRDRIESQLDAIRLEMSHLQAQKRTARRRVEIAESALEKLSALQARNHIGSIQLLQHEADVLEQTAAVQMLERQQAAIERQLAQTERELDELHARLMIRENAVAAELARIEQESLENQARGEWLLRAPLAGVVITQAVEVGQTIEQGRPVLSLMPEGDELVAHLFVPIRAMVHIEEGQSVMLRFHALPYQKHGHQAGHVWRVSHGALAPTEWTARQGRVLDGEPVFRVVVRLDRSQRGSWKRQATLLPGMSLEADLVLERSRVFDWLFRPMARMAPAQSSRHVFGLVTASGTTCAVATCTSIQLKRAYGHG